jgi:hypothetical protein
VATKDASLTETSSITQDTPPMTIEETNRRKALVRARLIENNLTGHEIDAILTNSDPYQLAFSGVRLPTWDVDKEVFLIMALRKQYLHHNNQHDE